MKIKTGDMVKVISGAHKGKTAKVIHMQPRMKAVKLEGIGTRTRHVKPNALNPQGSTKDIHVAIPVHKVAIVHPTDATKTSRIGFIVKKDGLKVRVARQAADKEIQ